MSSDSGKVTSSHLHRDAYLYVRQSTMYQVIHNTESTRRQYDLKGRAVALGWQSCQIHVIDVDQGSSGASAADRAGFQQLVAEVSLGRAGIVLGLECSRLARDNADWQQLIKICAINGTLICDEDGLYDPADPNDRLLLGVKGQISEFELHYLQARMRGGLLAKAARGELALRLPVGLCYDAASNVPLDPDRGVRAAVTRLFTTFEATGSATAVVKAFAADKLTFPARDHTGPRAGQLYWKPLRLDQVLFILHNPRYAGAYCYGRRTHRSGGGKTSTTIKPRDQRTTLIPGAHDGYITWAQFEANQATLAASAAARGGDRKAGPPREGPALLQGLVICGRCGGRMTVNYHSRCDGTPVPDYACQRDGINTGTPPCQRICGSGIDQAVAGLVLDALTPLAIETALQVTAQLHAQAEQADALRATHVQRARHAADAARRRYLAVDPANRLVADALEADWNARLRDLADAEDDYQHARKQAAGPLTDAQLAQVRALAADLPALWHHPATSMKDRKRLIRLLVTDVTLRKDGDTITAHVRLPGGQDRTLTIPRPLTAWEAHTTPETTVALISDLPDEHPFGQIAVILGERGITGGWGRPYTVHSLAAVCRARSIPDHGTRLRAAGYLTAAEAAARLGVTVPTITKWQRAGLLGGRRIDGRGTCLFPPGQTRPVTGTARIARDRAAAGLLSARQLGAQLGVSAGTVTRWHHLGLIDAASHDHRGFPLYRAGQQRPAPAQITAAGRPADCRGQDLVTGGQLAARLGVVRSTVYKWHRLGLIDAAGTDNGGRRLYRSGQQAPRPGLVTAARAAAAACENAKPQASR
jgi:DNA invertase Pin-like site-specific DNA recombinase/DNA-binding transcriptional MerR regulator